MHTARVQFFTHFRRPGDIKGVDVLLTVGPNSIALLPAGVDHLVLLGACWDKDLAQEVVDIWRALQVYQGHKWLHAVVCDILIIVAHHVGEEGHVVGRLQAPMHSDRLTRKQAVSMTASHPHQCQAHPQWSWHQHCDE